MRMRPAVARSIGLLLGYGADVLLGDPRRWHPVAGFGRVAAAAERRDYRDSRRAGAGHVGMLVGAAVSVGAAAERVAPPIADRPTLLTAGATWAVLGGRTLRREATIVAEHLEAGDLAAARRRITHLVGRDPATLTRPESPGPVWNRWRRTHPTPWWHRWCGARWPAYPACSATGR